jgi:RNA polymerase sigma-70 factor, ECF subfamily
MKKEISLDDFDSLYREFGPMVLRRCRFLLQDEEKAVDVMQDTFVRIIEHRTKLTDVCSSLFYTTATRLCLNKIRSDKIRKGPAFDDVAMCIKDNISSMQEDVTDTKVLLETIFADSKESTREMAILHYVDGLTLEETAKEMNMSVSGVRKRLASLRKLANEVVNK